MTTGRAYVIYFCFYFLCFSTQNMSGQDFIYALQRLEFENFNKTTGQSFAWMFDCDPLRPFLDWFCDELQTSNVLKSSELEQ